MTLTEAIKQRKEALEEAIASGERAKELEGKLPGHREELARLEARRDRALELGEAKATVEYSVEFKGFGPLQAEPVRSRQTGNEIAAELQARVDVVQATIDGIESEIAEVLAQQ